MKISFLFLFLIVACSPSGNSQKVSGDDYVLIEFASKLEEDEIKKNTPPDLKIDGEKQGIRQDKTVK